MDSRQARELMETMAGAGSVWSWSLHPQHADLNAIAHEADLIGEQVSAFIFRRTVDAIERGERPETVSIIVDVDTGTQRGFTCPRCRRTSYNPNDKRWGYCGACHEFTACTCTPDTSGWDPTCPQHGLSRDATRAGGSQPTGSA